MTKNDTAAYSGRPLLLETNRVWRTYTGGKRIEQWQGNPDGADGQFPEEWIASTVRASNPGREQIVEGLSRIASADGHAPTLQALIAADPASLLGRRHADVYGDNPAVLVKVIDSAERLTIQVHPDRAFARREFGSDFGKTEAWYILGGRTVDGEEPALYVGFKPGVTRDEWKRLFDEQDIPGMLGALHRVPVRAGDVYLIRGGLPHAIGSGCFLIEIQEPTDYTLRTEKVTPGGRAIPDIGCHQGLGFERMLDAFHYESGSREDMLQTCRIEPVTIQSAAGGTERQLIGREHTDRFAMRALTVRDSYRFVKEDRFCVAVVVSGAGAIAWQTPSGEAGAEPVTERLALEASQQWFLPAALEAVTFEAAASSGAPLEIVLCFPPEGEA